DKLLSVPGIGKIRVERIKKSWVEQKEIKNIMLFLQGHDVSTSHATKIYKTYGNDSISVVQENPYRLADDIWGIGFRTADTIAAKMGFGPDRYERLRSGLMYTLNSLADEGHCYSTENVLITKAADILQITETGKLKNALEQMISDRDVITENIPKSAEIAIYLPAFFYAETGTARRISEICTSISSLRVDDKIVEKVVNSTSISYDEVQIQAIRTAVSSKMFVLTGGPGTGKTTTTLGIINAFRSAGANILLAAPTGRAAKRMTEATGMESKTIHRLLEFKPPEGCQRNAENPLEGDVLIVDECSMIDIILMYSLVKAIPDSMTVILVGDVDQLPSVGAGNVLRDIISSDTIPVVRLTKIFRQAQTSRIITNAHLINKGKMPDISNPKGSDFFFIECEDEEKRSGEIVNLIRNRLPKFYGLSPTDIQVLTPMQRGDVGAQNLNTLLQEKINPGNIGLKRGGTLYKPNDKVMQIRNNYDKEVFNGDIGVVAQVDTEERTLIVIFDGRPVGYEIDELDELVLAYAVTVHKSQGSEYPVVVMPVFTSHYVMLQQNLLYTGVTRAKKGLVLVGQKKAIA
ncbi:MAG: ATP-dependent RecD-like DNA helicase, partial [Oscillospiraceae bacterium]|nr:ATP-dependent RecD-like DNA helicase [Oscillospiraceae bacterium]